MRLPAKCLWAVASALWVMLLASASVDAKARYPLLGAAAPEVLQHLIAGPAGNFRLSDHRGEVVVVGFWTSWCDACADYLAMLQSLDQTYASAGLVVLAVSLDTERQSALDFVHPFSKKLRASNDGPETIGRLFAVEDVPLTVLIDRDGVVRYAHTVNDHINQMAIQRELKILLDE
jgi:thiol-disulfide isomerase/thioredoxin